MQTKDCMLIEIISFLRDANDREMVISLEFIRALIGTDRCPDKEG